MKYDLSIIIPFYKKYEEFSYTLNKNEKQYELAKEVIIIFDEVIDKNKYLFLKEKYSNINFKFFMNIQNHSWRNPVISINQGIKNSSGEFIIILSPETILMDNAIYNLIKTTSDNTFTVGLIIFIIKEVFQTQDKNILYNAFSKTLVNNGKYLGPMYYGSICCKKENFAKVNYYSENFIFTGWGGDDDDVRNKLIKLGMKMIKSSDVKAYHIDSRETFFYRQKKKYKVPSKFAYDHFIEINLFDNIEIKPQKEKLINSISQIKNITNFEIKDNLKNYYQIVLLAQCYNEKKYISEFLENTGVLVDGIIVLNDSSIDNSWELLNHQKLLCKYTKKRTTFNDLENRNSLLEVFSDVFIKNNIQIDWVLWLDFDERIENENINEIKDFLNKTTFNIFNIPFVHMWSDTEYNINYPSSKDGIQLHTRIFRHKYPKSFLPYKIQSNIELHFQLSPYEDETKYLPLLIKHLGRNSQELRYTKYILYTQHYDKKNIQNYKHFVDNSFQLKNYDKKELLQIASNI